ncbi:hypothetical protein [Xanthomonas theicola]|uniref:hypothetical protein n=1 Tax=Xanthomonas theicola TaxID=56464 RepID=UPI000FF88E34|nr:hypothetical protein [Xanthomonas theicola]QNH25223.1 hypothetical protein G4Q83_11400 [Xanthomonas theicola]
MREARSVGPLGFTVVQAEKIATDMKNAVDVLLVQRSGMKGKKLGGLRDLASLLCGCFSKCRDDAIRSSNELSSIR